MVHVETPSGRWGPFCSRVLAFLQADLIDLAVDGRTVRGFRSPDSPALWLRDHSDVLRAGCWVEADVQSAVDAFADHQSVAGRLFDYVTTEPGAERENWEKWVRVPVEADVEYRFVKAAWLAWQATGDDAWVERLMPRLERALGYTLGHEWRWDEGHGLPKRAYTIDTWDFDYTAGRAPWLNFQITPDTFWGLAHGDASGLYEAMRLLARLHAHAGRDADAARWRSRAASLRDRANRVLFNGRFYTHFVKLSDVTVEGVDEAEQLSLSNPAAINRGLATPEIAAAVLAEYQCRRAATGAFAEWFSIDPPFPDGAFGDEKLVGGAYVNGGIMPLVGGELARAAFEHGEERYGVATLDQYREMVAESGETYLWYFPDGTHATPETSTSPEAQPTDGWGSSAMLWALVEGLAGVQDRAHSFRRVRLAPRWAAAGESEAEVRVGYAASGAAFGYDYAHDAGARVLRLRVEAEAEVDLHLLLPPGTRPTEVRWDGGAVPFERSCAKASTYADARGRAEGESTVEVHYVEA